MIARIWHGWTTPENANAYEKLLKTEVFPSIEKKSIKGYRKISLLKYTLESEIEFITIMLFEDLECVKGFVGSDYESSYVPEKAKQILKKYDKKSKHYEIKEEQEY